MAFDESLKGAEIPAPASSGKEKRKSKPINGRVEISTDPEGNLANMVLYPPENGGKAVTVQDVMDQLKKHGVIAGIDDFDIRDMVEANVFETSICVARAIPPRNGKNGHFSYRFPQDVKLTPQQDEYGIANFRELNSITPIKKGDIIADITPPTPGEPGMNVFGKAIPAQPGACYLPPLGKNTLITADGKSMVSAVDGHIVFGRGRFIVEDTVIVNADLDISVGNINFFGDVHIRGDVQEGFTINAGKNVKIDGTVFGGHITAGGNVKIAGGCLSSTVECGGDANFNFCENSHINSKGNISGNQFAFCDIFCFGTLTARGSKGVILGGKLTAMHDVTAGIIGSEKYTTTEINIGDGSVLFARKRKAEAELAQASEICNSAQKNIEYLKHRKQAQGELNAAQQQQIKAETQNKLIYGMRMKELVQLIEQLDNDIRNKDALMAKCTGTIYPGARFCINFLTLDITEEVKRSSVTIVDDRISVVPNK